MPMLRQNYGLAFWERTMMISKAGVAAVLTAIATSSACAEPRVSAISQWSAGNDGAAMNAFGELVTKAGAKWEHNPVSGPFTDLLNKLRADLIAGRPPAVSQLKGPEIKAWSALAPTVNLDSLVAEAGYEKLVSADLAKSTSRTVTGSPYRCRSSASTRCMHPKRRWTRSARRRCPRPGMNTIPWRRSFRRTG